jgi:2,3-bisphosphoglycerate-dependent phosphoglycerate mutase
MPALTHKKHSQPVRNLILVRHSLPLIQPELPASQWSLSDEGLLRAALLPDLLIPYKPPLIIASKETKAQQTAQVIAKTLKLPLLVKSDLHEHERPQAVGLYSRDQFETLLSAFFEDPDRLIFGSESADEAYLRFSGALDRLIRTYPQESLVLVSHGTVISLFVSRRCGVPPFHFWKQLGLPSIIILSLPDFHLRYVIESIQ